MAFIKKLVMQGFKSFAKKTEILFDPGINVIIGPNGSGKCLVGSSLVQLADGSSKRIDELVNTRLDSGVRTEDGFIVPGDGTKVMCLDFNKLKVEGREIKAFVKRTSPSKLLKIKTRSGRSITATKYHPFFVLRDGNVVSAKAEELKEGVRIAVPRKLELEPKSKYFFDLLNLFSLKDNMYIPYREEFEIILRSLKGENTWNELAKKIDVNYYCIKGLLDKQSIQIVNLIKILRYCNLSDKEIVERIETIRANSKDTKFDFMNSKEFSRFFGYLLAEGRLSDSSQIWFTNGNEEIVQDYVSLVKKLFGKDPLVRQYKPNCWDVIIFSQPLITILRRMGMASKTEDKKISNIFLKNSGTEEVAELLNGLYCGDGYVSKNCDSIEITTKSKSLARSVETCLLRLGIFSRSKTVKKSFGEFVGEYQQISIFGVNNIREFHKNIKLVHKGKKERISKGIYKIENTNLDLIEANDVVRSAVKDLGINVKRSKKNFPRLDSYCYNQCIPSRNGLLLLTEKLLRGDSQNVQKLKILSESDIFWDELIEVKEVEGEEWVYDLTVEGNHNFVANNIFAHNSNISDAMCFVLGRLSIKSMRAAKASNLIFMGSKYAKPAKEAVVELIFNNSDRAFNLPSNEVSLKRIVRRNGQGVYKINDETKTRGEIIELLAHAGIDPHGFNMVLQGQIQSIVKIQSEDRRKIVEEVAGIAIYETRKEKSLKELEKTEIRLKEISTILRERTAYLNNLEKEKRQAERFRDLEKIVKRAKATIYSKKLEGKKKEVSSIKKSIEEKEKDKEKVRRKVREVEEEGKKYSEKIEEINSQIKQSTGLEQEKLHDEIADLRAEIEGLRVRKENYENKKEEIERRVEELEQGLPDLEQEISELRRESPLMAKKAEELKKKKAELSEIEEKRKRLHGIKKEVEGLRERIRDKESQKAKILGESEELVKELESLSRDLKFKSVEEVRVEVERLFKVLRERENDLEGLNKKEIENEKIISVSEIEIKKAKYAKKNVSEIEICPLCQSKLTEEHKGHVFKDSDEKIGKYAKEGEGASKKLKKINEERVRVRNNLRELTEKIRGTEKEISHQKEVREKKERLKVKVSEQRDLELEIKSIGERLRSLEGKGEDLGRIEESYDRKILEIEEISSRTEEDVDTVLLYKERELENMKNIIKRSKVDSKDVSEQVEETRSDLEDKEKDLEKKENQEEELNKRFKKFFEERDKIQKQIQKNNLELSERQGDVRQIEEQVNYLKIGKAKLDAEAEALEMELSEYKGIELLQGSIEVLQEKLQKAQNTLQSIGNINMRALEVYEQVKEEYERVYEKVETLNKEKIEIMKIIEEIDKKKKKTFMKTFKAINDLFTENFAKLSRKGVAYLELENKEDVFAGGVNIVVKLAKGKYFDVTSLSGGEQTLVALSLLFAVQEYKPYHFYIFDEIDAALDKRNSERLAGLLQQYMKSGQYVVVTHNDAIILESNLLYGVSMHEGVSKILSLKVEEN